MIPTRVLRDTDQLSEICPLIGSSVAGRKVTFPDNQSCTTYVKERDNFIQSWIEGTTNTPSECTRQIHGAVRK